MALTSATESPTGTTLPWHGAVISSAIATLALVLTTGVPMASASRNTPGTPSKSDVSTTTAAPAIAGSGSAA